MLGGEDGNAAAGWSRSSQGLGTRFVRIVDRVLTVAFGGLLRGPFALDFFVLFSCDTTFSRGSGAAIQGLSLATGHFVHDLGY
jgi:hypothetical protein